jgi:hypothetical protein
VKKKHGRTNSSPMPCSSLPVCGLSRPVLSLRSPPPASPPRRAMKLRSTVPPLACQLAIPLQPGLTRGMGPSTLFPFRLLSRQYDRNLVSFPMDIHFAEFIGHPAHNGLQSANRHVTQSPRHEIRDGCARSVPFPLFGPPQFPVKLCGRSTRRGRERRYESLR